VGGVVTHRWRHGELRSLSEGVPFLALANPGLGGTPRTTPTLACAVTYLPPGLHSLPAPDSTGVRVLLEGEVGFTPAAGAAFRLSARDVVRTGDIGPGEWEAGDSGALWLDAVDMPLVSALSSGDGMRPRRPGPGPCAFAEGADCLTPTRVHRWAQTRTVLEQAAAQGSFPGIARFGAPRRGRDLTATVRAEVHRVEAGRRTPSVRANQSAVVVVLGGAGSTVVDGCRLSWGPGDVFVLPAGAPVDHHADVTADLLIVSDAPALAALGLWWADTDDVHQPIDSTLE
jgi:gentisate 1,2-dioxygenase